MCLKHTCWEDWHIYAKTQPSELNTSHLAAKYVLETNISTELAYMSNI